MTLARPTDPQFIGLLMLGPLVVQTRAGVKRVTRRVGARWGLVRPRTRLWVRETFAALPEGGHAYAADLPPGARSPTGRWTPKLLMPYAACRLVLIVTDVREVPGDVSDVDDAEARLEGVLEGAAAYRALWRTLHPRPPSEPVFRVAFEALSERDSRDEIDTFHPTRKAS